MGSIHEVAKTDEIGPGEAKLIEIDGQEIALFNLNGEFYAISNECSHVGGPLCEGDVEGDKVVCPWHGERNLILKAVKGCASLQKAL